MVPAGGQLEKIVWIVMLECVFFFSVVLPLFNTRVQKSSLLGSVGAGFRGH